jgi:hypothetical protein
VLCYVIDFFGLAYVGAEACVFGLWAFIPFFFGSWDVSLDGGWDCRVCLHGCMYV